MTVIIGMAHEGTVYIGADSAGSDGWTLRSLATPKIFAVGEFLIGYTTSFRMGQILHYHLALPARDEDETDEHYVVAKFVEAVRSCLKDRGFTTVSNNVEEAGRALVGYRGHIYMMQSDFSIIRHANAIEAVGIGDKVALGAMLALDNLEPEARIQRTLEIVGQLSDGVLPPYHVETLEPHP